MSTNHLQTNLSGNEMLRGFAAMAQNNISVDSTSALENLQLFANPILRKVLRPTSMPSNLKYFEGIISHSKGFQEVMASLRKQITPLTNVKERQDVYYEALFYRKSVEEVFGIDLLEDTTMTALMYSRWYNGQQRVYVVEQDLYDGISVSQESEEKLQPIFPISQEIGACTEKLTKLYYLCDGNIEAPAYRDMGNKIQQLENKIFECDAWKVENLPPLKENELEPTMVILPNGRTLLVCGGKPKDLSECFGKAWKHRMHHKSSRFMDRLLFQMMINAHTLMQQLNSGFFVAQLNTFEGFGHGTDKSFSGSTIYVNYGIEMMKHTYFEYQPMIEFWLDARKSAREALNFISALQHPKTVVTHTSNQPRKKRKKKFKGGYQPRVCTIKVAPETLNLIRPLREPSQRTGREMPRFDVSAGRANRWVTRAKLEVGETILATKQGKRNNRLYLVNRPRVGYTCNGHKDPVAKTERTPKIVKAKRF